MRESFSDRWVVVWEGEDEFQATLITGKLRAGGLHPVLLNFKEYAYRTSGFLRILVHVEEVGRALALLTRDKLRNRGEEEN